MFLMLPLDLFVLDDLREQLSHVKSHLGDCEGERLEAVAAYQSLQSQLEGYIATHSWEWHEGRYLALLPNIFNQ